MIWDRAVISFLSVGGMCEKGFGLVVNTYPEWQVDFSLFGRKFQYSGMRQSVLEVVADFEEHGVGDMKSGEFVQGTGWHEDLAAMICSLSFGPGHHDYGVAAVELVEAPRSWTTSSTHGRGIHAAHHGVLVVERRIELGEC